MSNRKRHQYMNVPVRDDTHHALKVCVARGNYKSFDELFQKEFLADQRRKRKRDNTDDFFW